MIVIEGAEISRLSPVWARGGQAPLRAQTSLVNGSVDDGDPGGVAGVTLAPLPGSPLGRNAWPKRLAERSEHLPGVREGEQQQIGHAEGAFVRAEGGAPD